jgi:hypothetical protein
MDKITKGMIKALIERLEHASNPQPVRNSKTAPYPDQEPKAEADQPDPHVPVRNGALPPPPAETNKTVTCEIKQTKLDKFKTGAEIFGIALLLIYTIYTAKMYCANKQAADTATGANEIAKTALIAANRPWITSYTYPLGPLTISTASATLLIGSRLSNTGHSPGMSVWSDEELFLATPDLAKSIDGERLRFCAESERMHIPLGQTIFPGSDFVRTHFIGVPGKRVQEAIDAIPNSPSGGMLSPFVIVCVAYNSSLDEKILHTATIYELLRKDDRGGEFSLKSPETVPLDHLSFHLALWRPVIAD